MAGALGIDFDLLVSFTTSSKSLEISPDIAVAGACFDVALGLEFDGTNEITGLTIKGLSYSQEFGAVTVGFGAAFVPADYKLFYIETGASTGMYSATVSHDSDAVIYFWKPDVRGRDLSVETPVVLLDVDGGGPHILTSQACYTETATINNVMTLDIDGDACCGGLFDVNIVTYFGDIVRETVTALYGTYYWDNSVTAGWVFEWEFMGSGSGYDDDTDNTEPLVLTVADTTHADADTCEDPCQDLSAQHAVEYVSTSTDVTSTPITRILGWVQTDVEFSIGIGSNVDLTFGLDVSWWGWEQLEFGITFTW